jgi:hypothetical protein
MAAKGVWPMSKKEKICSVCCKPFVPEPRIGKRQKTCSQTSCQRKRKNRQWWRWAKLNPKYVERRKKERRLWAQVRDYWKKWRRKHPLCVFRDNRRRCLAAQEARRSAKPIQLKTLRTERLLWIHQLAQEAENSAKPIQIARLAKALADYLWLRDRSAKPIQSGLNVAVGDNKGWQPQEYEPGNSPRLPGTP